MASQEDEPEKDDIIAVTNKIVTTKVQLLETIDQPQKLFPAQNNRGVWVNAVRSDRDGRQLAKGIDPPNERITHLFL